MCRRAQEPAQGQWTLPAGFLECGETLEQAAARETFEETGVMADPAALDLCAVANLTATNQVVVTFRTELDTEPLVRAGPECLEVAFLSESDMEQVDVAWRKSFGVESQQFFDELRSRQFRIRLATFGSATGVGARSREYLIGVGETRKREA